MGEALPGLRVLLYEDPEYEDVSYDGDEAVYEYKTQHRPDNDPTEEGLIPHLTELPEGGVNIAYWSTFDDVMEGENWIRSNTRLRDAESD